MSGEKKEEAVSRRKYLGAVAGLGVAAVVGWGLAGYLASKPAAPAVEKTVTITKTITGAPTVITPSIGPAKLNFIVESEIKEYVEKALDEFKIQYPNVTVNLIPVPYDQIYEKVSTSLAAKSPEYDVINVSDTMSSSLFASGHIEPLDNYINSPLRDPEFKLEDFFEEQIKGMCTGLDGKLYALPYVYDCYQMVWNKKIFEEYGITDAPDTWDKVYNYGKKITELAKGKVWGVAFEGRYFQWDLIPWARTFGVPGHLWDPTTHKPLLNHPATIEALEWAVKLMEVAPPGVISYGDYDCAKSYMAGEVAMAFVWTRAEIEDPSKSLAAGVTEYSPIPKKVSYASYGSGHNFMLNKYGKNKDAAYKLIEFLLKPTIQLKYMKYKGPTVKQGLKPEYLKAYPYLKGFEATLPYVTFDPRIPEIREVYDIMGKWVSKALLKEIDAKTACDNMQAEVEKLLAKYVR